MIVEFLKDHWSYKTEDRAKVPDDKGKHWIAGGVCKRVRSLKKKK